MSIVRLENISKAFAGTPVLEEVSFRVEEGEKIGLIGRNGTGKTTIFRMITGEMAPENGVVERMRRAKIAYLAQMPELPDTATIFDIVMESFSELLELEAHLADLEKQIAAGDESVMERYSLRQDEFALRGGYTFRADVKRVLHGLGFREEEFGLHFSALSGGQRTRLMLALVLLQDADLLLLDEPENHLDLEAREWLEGFLRDSAKAFVIISHDRLMLNAVVNRVVEIERGSLIEYTGNYDAYLARKVLQREQQQKAYERQQAHIEKEEKWIERFRYKNTKASQVQSRIKRLEKLERVEAPLSDASSARFNLGEVVRSGQVVLEGKDLRMAYDALTLYSDVDLEVRRGERIGIIGPNGSGKTTLLRHLAGKLEGGQGEVQMGHKVTLGFFDQHHEGMNRANDILTEVRSVRPEMMQPEMRNYLGRFLFSGEEPFKQISTLSGGELCRVAMAKLILSGANVLLLDEPTNHLDIASREALEESLMAFTGTLVVVSHDRTLIDKLSDRLVVLENGKATIHLGNYSDYRRKHEEEKAGAKSADEVLQIRKPGAKQRKATKDEEREHRKKRRELEELERNIEAIEELISDQEAAFADIDPADYETLQKAQQEYDIHKHDLANMYQEWEALADELAR